MADPPVDAWAMLTAGMGQGYDVLRATAESITDDPHAVEVLHHLAAWSGYFAGHLEEVGFRPREFVRMMALADQMGAPDA